MTESVMFPTLFKLYDQIYDVSYIKPSVQLLFFFFFFFFSCFLLLIADYKKGLVH